MGTSKPAKNGLTAADARRVEDLRLVSPLASDGRNGSVSLSMTPICCALIVRGTSSFLPIVRACANKVRSLSPLQRASAKPSISANNAGCLWTKSRSRKLLSWMNHS